MIALAVSKNVPLPLLLHARLHVRISREHLEEMLRWRIVASVFAAEWRRITRADLRHELQRLREGGASQTAADPTTGLSPRFPRRVRRAESPRR
jgi:hypothetical protein